MRKAAIVVVVAFAICCLLSLPASSQDKKPKTPLVIEYDFGTKIVSVRTSSTKADGQFGFTGGYLEKVQVRRLGDRGFVVGDIIYPEVEENPYEGSTLWIPLSNVLELGEFESKERVKKIIKNMRKLGQQFPAPETSGRIH